MDGLHVFDASVQYLVDAIPDVVSAGVNEICWLAFCQVLFLDV